LVAVGNDFGCSPTVEKRKIDAIIRLEIGNLFANGRDSVPGKSYTKILLNHVNNF